MDAQTPQFSRDQLVEMLAFLNEELGASSVLGEVCIVGGAAMILAFGSRESTRDIDALLLSPASVRAAVARVAQAHGFPANWLNDGAKGFASGQPFESKAILSFSHLRIVAPPAGYILAMKCIAARVGLDEHDKSDTKFLIRHLGLLSPADVLEIVETYYPKERIPAKTQYFVEEVCHELFP